MNEKDIKSNEEKLHENFKELLKIRLNNIKSNRKKANFISIMFIIEFITCLIICILINEFVTINSATAFAYYFNIAVKVSLYLITIITISLIHMVVITFIGRTSKSKDFKKAFIENKIHNSKNELPIVDSEEELDNNSKHHIVENMGIGIDKFSCKTTGMEAIIDEKILYIINKPETSKQIIIKTQDWKTFNDIKEIKLKSDDINDDLVYIDNMVVIGATGEGKTTFIKFWLGKLCFYYNAINNNDLELFVLDHKNRQ